MIKEEPPSNQRTANYLHIISDTSVLQVGLPSFLLSLILLSVSATSGFLSPYSSSLVPLTKDAIYLPLDFQLQFLQLLFRP
jgi:hypothetical protein